MLSIMETIPALVEYYWIVNLVLILLGTIASLGGIAVIAGGFLMTTDRFSTGKFITGLGLGTSLIGLIISIIMIIWSVFLSGSPVSLVDITTIIPHSAGGLGIVLSIIGRRTAKKPE
jgi:hypothetical protein